MENLTKKEIFKISILLIQLLILIGIVGGLEHDNLTILETLKFTIFDFILAIIVIHL